MAGQQM
jgi:hypothetical protein